MENSDMKTLIERIKKRDKTAFEILYKEMKNCIYALAFACTRSHCDSEEIVQNTFLHIWSKAETQNGDDPRAWVMTIARNQSYDYIRKNRNSRRNTELNEEIKDKDYIESKMEDHHFRNYLSILSDDQREIVVLRIYGFSYSEISEIKNVPVPTLKWRYGRAIKKLIKIAGDESE